MYEICGICGRTFGVSFLGVRREAFDVLRFVVDFGNAGFGKADDTETLAADTAVKVGTVVNGLDDIHFFARKDFAAEFAALKCSYFDCQLLQQVKHAYPDTIISLIPHTDRAEPRSQIGKSLA